MFRQIIFKLFTLLLVVPLMSCGGSSVELSYEGPTINGPDFSSTTPQLPTAVVSIGPISGLSRLIVNSVAYDTGVAGIRINGKPGVPDDLRVGYVVTINGMLDTAWKSGTADQISFNANIIGPVESVDPVRRRLLIMGQSVWIDADTRFAPPLDLNSLFNLTNGALIQVSGLSDANGEVVATHVQLVTSQKNFQVIGGVSGINFGTQTFRINGLTVDYNSTLVMNLPGGAPSNGMVVIARGSLGTDGELQVSELTSHIDTSEFVTDSRVELTGYIMRYDLDTDFFVNGLSMETEFHTIFHNGMRTDLALGVKIEINGRWSTSDTVIAEAIWFGN
ncbi:MAG: hypothetical protein KZQ95_09290 [Candidatus Thiodiazotropha sp. (ex Epidulcina cf. delphinae)]|nr:hypothetical protein [Candidatus Thiodiazotropha sp. (ex Epidulcina cf. delphinae)]